METEGETANSIQFLFQCVDLVTFLQQHEIMEENVVVFCCCFCFNFVVVSGKYWLDSRFYLGK